MENAHNKVIDFILSTAVPFPSIQNSDEKKGGNGDGDTNENEDESASELYVVRHSVLPQQWDDNSLASDHAPVFAQFVVASPR